MHIAGYEPLTLIDYPDHLATIVFTPGCVLRCPYCHNPELVQAIPGNPQTAELFTASQEKDFFHFLHQRTGVLDGVVITGGEPTLQPDLIDFIRRVKNLGFLVKLDTNGVFPDIVKTILATQLVDYWAMDIKHTPEKYHLASGRNIPIEVFQRSVELIMGSGVPYEFRTTVVPTIHEYEDFLSIGEWIRGARAYYLQPFRPGKVADTALPDRIGTQTLNLEKIRLSLLPYMNAVEIRG